MPAFTRSNLDQFGPLGVVFAIGSWLVVFGGVLVVGTVVGRQLGEWWVPERAEEPHPPEEPSSSGSTGPRLSGLVNGDVGPGLPGGDAAGEEERAQRQQGEHEERRPQAR